MSPNFLRTAAARRSAPAARALPPTPPLLSPHWFRVADLKPLLQTTDASPAQDSASPGRAPQRQVLRGEVWHALVSADGRHSFRVNAAAWSAVARCDGQHSAQQVWAAAQAEHGEAAPTQAQLMQMFAQLHAAGLLSFDRAPDFGEAAYPHAALASGSAHPAQSASLLPRHRQHLLAWRVSLGNPEPTLAALARGCNRCAGLLGVKRLQAWWPGCVTAAGVFTSAGVLTVILLAALLQAHELVPALQRVASTPSSWALAGLMYPVLKLLHEAAHGAAARHFGAAVCDWGITWLVLVPVPYVDASAASALAHRRQRLAVSAAGIAAELAVAALACSAALLLQPGAWRDAALMLCVLAAGSSMLVNANPLLRFDGYHMLCDALGLPNLASRSGRHWQQVLCRLLAGRGRLRDCAHHGLGAPAAQVTAPGEAPWLWCYAPAAAVMRWVVGLAVVWLLGSWSQALGLLALLGLLWQGLLQPLRALLRVGAPASSSGPGLAPSAAGGSAGLRAFASTAWARSPSLGPALALAAVLLWPLPMATVAQGVVWLPEQALLRTQTRGWVQAVHVADGQTVQPGDAVLTLHNPDLQAEAGRLLAKVQDLQADEARALRDDPTAVAAAGHALQAALADWQQNRQQLQELTLRAQAPGRIALAHAADLPGRHLPRGTLVGHVMTAGPGIVQVAIAQENAAVWPTVPSPVQVLALGGASASLGAPGALPHSHPQPGLWRGLTSGAQHQLPAAALGSRSGGRVPVDPADAQGLRAMQPVVVGEVQLQGAAADRIGQRVLVRFEHGSAPLLLQAARALQQQVLRHFNPAQ